MCAIVVLGKSTFVIKNSLPFQVFYKSEHKKEDNMKLHMFHNQAANSLRIIALKNLIMPDTISILAQLHCYVKI